MRWPGLGLLLLALVACDGGGSAEHASDTGGRLEITGSGTVAPLIAEIGSRFEAVHPEARIAVQTGGSSRGISDASSGLADIGMASRELTAGEQERLVQHRIAVDGVALIVHANNPVRELERDQVIGLFTGAIDNWSRLGGPDRPVTIVDKADGRATLTVFLEHFGLERDAIAADMIIGDNQHGIRAVAGNPGAIGYVSIGAAAREVERGTAIRMPVLAGQAATLENVRSGAYPLSRDLILVTGPEPSPLARRFLAFVRDPAMHDLYRDFGYVPATQ